MEEKILKPTHIPLISGFSEKYVNLVKRPKDSYTPSYLAGVLISLALYWSAQENKPKKLLISSTNGIQGLISLNEKDFQVTLKEDFLKGSMDGEFQFQEIQLENESTSVCPDISNVEKPS